LSFPHPPGCFLSGKGNVHIRANQQVHRFAIVLRFQGKGHPPGFGLCRFDLPTRRCQHLLEQLVFQRVLDAAWCVALGHGRDVNFGRSQQGVLRQLEATFAQNFAQVFTVAQSPQVVLGLPKYVPPALGQFHFPRRLAEKVLSPAGVPRLPGSMRLYRGVHHFVQVSAGFGAQVARLFHGPVHDPQGVWVLRVPDRSHKFITGLGNLGLDCFHLIEHLLRSPGNIRVSILSEPGQFTCHVAEHLSFFSVSCYLAYGQGLKLAQPFGHYVIHFVGNARDHRCKVVRRGVHRQLSRFTDQPLV